MFAVLMLFFVLIAAGCQHEGSQRNPVLPGGIEAVYKAPQDICGEIVFQEKIADSFQEALEEILRRKHAQGFENIKLVTQKLRQVTDLAGKILDKELYVVIVTDQTTGHKVHSWAEVIDNDGNLFVIHWCPD